MRRIAFAILALICFSISALAAWGHAIGRADLEAVKEALIASGSSPPPLTQLDQALAAAVSPGYLQLGNVDRALFPYRNNGRCTITCSFVREVMWRRSEGGVTTRRRLEEMVVMFETDLLYSSEAIVAAYSKLVTMGRCNGRLLYGMSDAASCRYGVAVDRLSMTQIASLVAASYSPGFYSDRYPERLLRKRNVVLGQMMSAGIISAENLPGLMAAPLDVAEQGAAPNQSPPSSFSDAASER